MITSKTLTGKKSISAILILGCVLSTLKHFIKLLLLIISCLKSNAKILLIVISVTNFPKLLFIFFVNHVNMFYQPGRNCSRLFKINMILTLLCQILTRYLVCTKTSSSPICFRVSNIIFTSVNSKTRNLILSVLRSFLKVIENVNITFC